MIRKLFHSTCDKKISMREEQITKLYGQIQELKAINNYQTLDLEKKVISLEEQIGELSKDKGEKQ